MEPSHPEQASCIQSIFLNNEPRLRAGWRLLIQTILLGFFTTCAVLPFAFAPEFILSSTGTLFAQIAEFFAITLSILLARRFLDKRTFVSLGTKIDSWAFLDLLTGIAITFVMMGMIFAIQWAAGWITFEAFAWQVDSLPTFLFETFTIIAIFVLVGWNEELLSRGYHLQTIESGINTFWGILLSSVVFGVFHLGNPNATGIGTLGIMLAGVFLAYAYLRTRQLWLAIGLHIGWNFFQGPVFGFPVSGQIFYRLTRISVDGPELWTGGPFGPEAGLILLPALILGTVLVYAYTRGRLGDKDNVQKGTDILYDSLLPE
jgi:membrane protease YdiL (CAAX protease family)